MTRRRNNEYQPLTWLEVGMVRGSLSCVGWSQMWPSCSLLPLTWVMCLEGHARLKGPKMKLLRVTPDGCACSSWVNLSLTATCEARLDQTVLSVLQISTRKKFSSMQTCVPAGSSLSFIVSLFSALASFKAAFCFVQILLGWWTERLMSCQLESN